MYKYRDTLPTIEEAQEFLRLINIGRQAIGLEEIDKLEFDESIPGSMDNCLSARHLIYPAGGVVGPDCASLRGDANASTFRRVLNAFGMKPRESNDHLYFPIPLPDAILKVTDPFDSRVPGLRERLVEAGVV
jgi:hypothetical protein